MSFFVRLTTNHNESWNLFTAWVNKNDVGAVFYYGGWNDYSLEPTPAYVSFTDENDAIIFSLATGGILCSPPKGIGD